MYSIANFLGRLIASKLNFDHSKRDVVIYGTFVLIHNLAIIFGILLAAVLTGLLREIIVLMFVFGILRRLGGGFHLGTPALCMIASIIMFPLMGLISSVSADYLFTVSPVGRIVIIGLMCSYSLISVKLYAPGEHSNHPLSANRRKRLKLYTLFASLFLTGCALFGVFFGGSFFKDAVAISTALILFSINLLPAVKVVVGMLDEILFKHFKKEAKN